MSTTTGTVSLVQRDPWNDGGTKEFKLSIAMNEGGPFTEVAKTTEYTGCPKKTQLSGILAITPLWKGLELKVGGVSKTSGNSLCDRHKNFPI